MKSNAGKHIIANPSLFVMGNSDIKDIEGVTIVVVLVIVSIRSSNVDALISIAKNMKRKEEQYDVWSLIEYSFKLQFNVFEISQLFFDKVKDAPETELIDLLNKRV